MDQSSDSDVVKLEPNWEINSKERWDHRYRCLHISIVDRIDFVRHFLDFGSEWKPADICRHILDDELHEPLSSAIHFKSLEHDEAYYVENNRD